MISKLEIKNLQSHKHTILEFSKGVNVIVGETDVGKTAVIRALRLVIHNKPSGERYRSYWGGDTAVKVTTSEGVEVSRIRTDKDNLYEINGEEFRAFKQGVPDEVQTVLNMGEVNIQQQHNSPFLLSSTAGEVAAHFNKIANISVIDRSITKAKSLTTKTKQSIKQREEDLQEKLVQYEQYKNLEQMETELVELENKQRQVSNLQRQVQELRVQTNRLVVAKTTIKEVEHEILFAPIVRSIIDKKLKVYYVGQDYDKLKQNLIVCKLKIEALKIRKEKISFEEPTKQLIEKTKKVQGLIKEKLKLFSIVATEKSMKDTIKLHEEGIKKNQDKLPEVCPACNGTGKLK